MVLGKAGLLLVVSYGITWTQAGSQQSSSAKTEGCDNAKTQLEMNQCSAAEQKNAEAELNSLYKHLIARASNPAYRKKIEAAQKAWIAYRDAELEAKYPAQDKRGEYGSVYPMCSANDRTDLIRERIEEIKSLLNNSDDVCAGEWAHQKNP